MDYSALLGLIEADPAALELAEAGDCVGVADALNAPAISMASQYQLTTLKVMDLLGPIRGTAVLTALRATPGFGEVVRLMDDITAGVNLAHADAPAMFAMLVSAGIVKQDEADAILALKDRTIGVAEHALGSPVTHTDVGLAWAGRGS